MVLLEDIIASCEIIFIIFYFSLSFSLSLSLPTLFVSVSLSLLPLSQIGMEMTLWWRRGDCGSRWSHSCGWVTMVLFLGHNDCDDGGFVGICSWLGKFLNFFSLCLLVYFLGNLLGLYIQ